MQNDIPMSPRLVLLWKQSHREAGYDERDVPRANQEPRVCLYPASFVDRVQSIGFDKVHDFNFRGVLYADRRTQRSRRWIIEFARRYFTDRSFFQVTDERARRPRLLLGPRHRPLGEFDHTFERDGFVPKERPRNERGYFDEDYFRVLCGSEFTLCPAGDAPWSMRFYEAIMSKSLPIVESEQHTGRNRLEYAIGYKYLRASDRSWEYRPDWADENFRRFLEAQTLDVARPGSGSERLRS